ncbi:hypothetical protein [uncultured Jatrophihabitans sp.]|uniref:hypothetical protein n=1 Tax=uncultured Jatrophihabitans sp. TaxID=1610747 RepID=UPI0035CC2614
MPAAVGMTPLVVLGFLRVIVELDSRPARLAVGLIGLLFLLLVIAIVVSVPRTARLAVSSNRVELRGWFLRPRSFATQDVTTIVKARTSRTQVLLLDARGRRLLALNAPPWPRAGIDHVVDTIGAPIDLINTMAPKQLRTNYPGAVPFAYAHPLRFGILVNLAWIVLVIIVTVLVQL